jgi:hypothetical protein
MYGGILFGSELTAERGGRPEFGTVETGTSEGSTCRLGILLRLGSWVLGVRGSSLFPWLDFLPILVVRGCGFCRTLPESTGCGC